MNGAHDAMLDAVAVLALGALPAAEAAEVRAHVLGCEACRKEYAELRATADLVGSVAEATPDQLDELRSARMKSRVLRAIRSERPAQPALPLGPVQARSSWLAYAAAAAALVIALASILQSFALRSENAADRARIAALEQRADAQAKAADEARAQTLALAAGTAALIAPHSKHFPVEGGEVVASGGRLFIALRGLPPPPPGKVYQAWTLARGAKKVAPSVTFTPGEHGLTLVELPVDAASQVAVAVSVEPVGGSAAPTSTPRFLRALS